MRLIKVGLVAACLMALATPAQAAPSASMTIGPLTPSTPTPGQTVTATIGLSGCDATAVRITADEPYWDYTRHQHPYPPVDASPTSDPNVWTAPIKVPDDADPGADPLPFTATVTCASGSASASAQLSVRSFPPPAVRITPNPVRRGSKVVVVLSPCHGGLRPYWNTSGFEFRDSTGRDLPTSGATVAQTGPTGWRVTYVVDPRARPGRGSFVSECGQSDRSAVRLDILPAMASPSPKASSTSTPSPSPRPTPTSSPNASPTPAVTGPAAVSPSPSPSTTALEPASSTSVRWWGLVLVAVLVGVGGTALVRRLI